MRKCSPLFLLLCTLFIKLLKNVCWLVERVQQTYRPRLVMWLSLGLVLELKLHVGLGNLPICWPNFSVWWLFYYKARGLCLCDIYANVLVIKMIILINLKTKSLEVMSAIFCTALDRTDPWSGQPMRLRIYSPHLASLTLSSCWKNSSPCVSIYLSTWTWLSISTIFLSLCIDPYVPWDGPCLSCLVKNQNRCLVVFLWRWNVFWCL